MQFYVGKGDELQLVVFQSQYYTIRNGIGVFKTQLDAILCRKRDGLVIHSTLPLMTIEGRDEKLNINLLFEVNRKKTINQLYKLNNLEVFTYKACNQWVCYIIWQEETGM